MAKNVVVVGTQWGDEGKGKIVELADRPCQGGRALSGRPQCRPHAGRRRTVYKLNLVPSGIVRDGVKCYIGNGVVLDIHHLIAEIDELEKGGIDVRSRLSVSPGCSLILPYHSRARPGA